MDFNCQAVLIVNIEMDSLDKLKLTTSWQRYLALSHSHSHPHPHLQTLAYYTRFPLPTQIAYHTIALPTLNFHKKENKRKLHFFSFNVITSSMNLKLFLIRAFSHSWMSWVPTWGENLIIEEDLSSQVRGA